MLEGGREGRSCSSRSLTNSVQFASSIDRIDLSRANERKLEGIMRILDSMRFIRYAVIFSNTLLVSA